MFIEKIWVHKYVYKIYLKGFSKDFNFIFFFQNRSLCPEVPPIAKSWPSCTDRQHEDLGVFNEGPWKIYERNTMNKKKLIKNIEKILSQYKRILTFDKIAVSLQKYLFFLTLIQLFIRVSNVSTVFKISFPSKPPTEKIRPSKTAPEQLRRGVDIGAEIIQTSLNIYYFRFSYFFRIFFKENIFRKYFFSSK